MAITFDSYAIAQLHCDACGKHWDEDMSELATGYDVAYGYDIPDKCPECGYATEDSDE